jgi:hypothetical protein
LQTYEPIIVLNLVASSVVIAFELLWGVMRLTSRGRMVRLNIETGGLILLWILSLGESGIYSCCGRMMTL